MDLWEDVTSFLKKTVPIAASVFVPGSGGVVSSIISAVFDVDAGDHQAVLKAVTGASPNQIHALKEKVLKYEAMLIDLALEKEKLHLADVKDARAMSTELVKVTGKNDHNKIIMSWTTLLCFFGVIGTILLGYGEIDDNPLVLLLLGALISHVDQVYGYFFGSSKSSTDKTNILANKAG